MWAPRVEEDEHTYGRLKRGEGIFTHRRFMVAPPARDPGYRRFMDDPPARDPAEVGGNVLTYDFPYLPLNYPGASAEDPCYVGDRGNQEFIEVPIPPYIPKPGDGCKRNSMVLSSGTHIYMGPPCGVTYIFVQGKESACIVSRDLGKGEKIHDLAMVFIGLADVRLTSSSIIGLALEQPANMLCPYALVSVLLNPNDLNEVRESKPDSSHKDSRSRIVNEQAAVDFLKQNLENNTYMGTIQTAISALQCLYQENFKADEIEVYTAQLGQIDKLLPREEIELHLEVINNGTSSTAHLVGS